ncbi:MAG: HNH endonuclease [Acetatifactor sp.]|nr:HNH endonuclease [Acetatifactor sp.]
MQLPYSEELEIQYLSRLFDNTSECYKFFWFQAIVTKLLEGKAEITYNELLDEMVADAWYMVTEYHLNLGPKDNLEALVKYIREISGMKSSEKKSVILDYLKKCEDKEVMRMKRVLILNVPYRLQAPFMHSFKGKDWDVPSKRLIEKINQEKHLFYYFTAYSGLQTTIVIQPEWQQYIQKNQEIVRGWLQYNIILYLQKRNPSVPGIADKLYPPQERKLEKVKKYWRLILTLHPIQEIYNEVKLDGKDISLEFLSYTMLWQHDSVRAEFSSSLEEVILPIYQSARNCGFKNWIYKEELRESNNLLL